MAILVNQRRNKAINKNDYKRNKLKAKVDPHTQKN